MSQLAVEILENLDKDSSVSAIASFLVLHPEIEELVAASISGLLDKPKVSTPSTDTDSVDVRGGNLSNDIALMSSPMTHSYPQKMIFVVNMELNMGRGKQCAQVAHAALGLYMQMQQSNDLNVKRALNDWIWTGQKKIVVKADDIAQMKAIQIQAEQSRILSHLVEDAGHTQVAPGSETVLALFGTNEALDKLTGSLRLL